MTSEELIGEIESNTWLNKKFEEYKKAALEGKYEDFVKENPDYEQMLWNYAQRLASEEKK